MSRDSRYASRGATAEIDRARSLLVGDRVAFHGERQARWKVRACGERYVVLTKPFNNFGRTDRSYGRHHYTVIDLAEGIRGTDDCVGSLGYESDEEIEHALGRMESGDFEISVRNNVTLDIRRVAVGAP